MSLETLAMTSLMVVVMVSGIDLVVSSHMPINMATIMVSGVDLVKVAGIIIGAKFLAK